MVAVLPDLVDSDGDHDDFGDDVNGEDEQSHHDDRSHDELPDPSSAPHNAQLQTLLDLVRDRDDRQATGADEMPALVSSDDSDSDSGLPDLESEHDDDLYNDSDYHSSLDDSEDDDGDDTLPPLVDFPGILPSASTASVTHLGGNPPLNLDQLDAVDQLSHELDKSEGVVASSRLVSIV